MTTERRQQRRGGVETGLRTGAIWRAIDALVAGRQQDIGRPLRVLDLGGGTGGLAVALAERGHTVTVVDPNLDALASLRRRAAESSAGSRVTAVQGDAETLEGLGDLQGVDLVCCHGTLEVVDDPETTIARIADVLRPGAHLSLVTAQRAAAVLARVLAGQFGQARSVVTDPDGRYGPKDPLPRRFHRAELEQLLHGCGFTVEQVQGVRMFSDLVPSALLDSDAARAALLELEEAVLADPDTAFLAGIGTSVHVIASRD